MAATDRVYRALDATTPRTAVEVAKLAKCHPDTARRALRKHHDGEAITRSKVGRGYTWLGVQRWLLP
jgi:Fic family protein